MASHSSPSSAQAATSRNSIANGATSPTLPVEKHGKLHHPFPASIAPYPVNCEKAVIDADSLDVAFRLQLFEGNPSSIPAIRLDNPKTHPQRCLDVGCGSGDWLLAAAKVWPNTTFVGLDLMIGHQLPVQLLHGLGTSATSPVGATRDPGSSTPSSISHLRTTSVNGQNPTNNIANESSTGVAELSVLESRIQWVQANFLKTLPFYDDEFDYVHISGISRGVPEDKWDGFLSEISRVLAPGGHLEMIEEDVIFPIIPSSSSSSSSCEPDQTPSDPAHAAHTAMPFDQPAHNASGSAISNAKRSFRTSTSSSFYCIGNESLGDVNGESYTLSQSLNSTVSSNPFTSPPSAYSRRLSLSAASRFLAAAVPVPPPVPTLNLDTKLGRRPVAAVPKEDHDATSSPLLRTETSSQFPFQTTSTSVAPDSKLFNGPGGILVGGSLPSKRRPTSAGKRSHEPAIPFGWDGPPENNNGNNNTSTSTSLSPPQSPNEPSFTMPAKRKSSRRPKTTSSLASSIASMTNKATNSLSKLHRPSSAGSSITAVEEIVPAVPRLPSGLRQRNGQGSSHGEGSMRRPSHLRFSSPVSGPVVSQTRLIKHDHQLLQTLFYGVYERRFINTCPTAILPSMLNMYFQNVLVTPPIDFPTPPPPAMAREIVRREKRNMIQREFGRAGLENSQGVGLHLAQSLNNIKAVPHQVARLKGTGRLQHLGAWNDGPSDRLVKRAKSSPALRVSPTSPSGSQSSRALSPDWFSSNSSYRRSDSPVSSGVSFVATPTSVSTGDPMIQSPTRYIGGSSINDSTLSPDSITPTTPFIGVQGSKDEEEDAKLAIMGDGGCFTLESGAASIQEEQRPVSPRPPSSSRHMSVDGETLGVAESLNWTDDLDDLDILTCEGVEDAALKELHNFDHVAAQELGVFDGVAFEPEEAILEDIWDSRELLRDRVYVRPRATFAGQGLPVPSALLEMDDLSMGLHLTRCWTNVVACREAMWEELQRRAKLVGNPEGSEAVHRTTPLDEIQWVGTEKRLSDRDKFDLLFQRFEDDMRAWAAVGSEIPRKLSWIDPRYPHHGPVPFLNHNKNNASSSVMIESRRGSSSAASSISSPVHCYGWDDNRGPGKQGIVVPGVDTCRTLRVFIARKTEEGPSPGGNSMKISSILG